MEGPFRVVVRSSRTGRITMDTTKLRPKKTLERAQEEAEAQRASLLAQGYEEGEHGVFWRGFEWAKVEVRDVFWNRILAEGEKE